jgi:hypothetical protein
MEDKYRKKDIADMIQTLNGLLGGMDDDEFAAAEKQLTLFILQYDMDKGDMPEMEENYVNELINMAHQFRKDIRKGKNVGLDAATSQALADMNLVDSTLCLIGNIKEGNVVFDVEKRTMASVPPLDHSE